MCACSCPQCKCLYYVTSFHEYQGIQGHLKGLTLCLIPPTSPQKNQFSCHKRAASPTPSPSQLSACSPIPMMEIRLIKRAYCLWCHGYPVITHSMAAPPLFALKPHGDPLPPKSNQLFFSSTFTSDIVPDRLRTSLSTSRDGTGRRISEKRV